MNIKEYLNRINYKGNLIPELAVLRELQEKHLLNVPFENLDIHYGKPIELEIVKFYKKIVTEKRGGFCYELNGLFQDLLNKLGFKSKIISARVFDSEKRAFGEEYDHLAIVVELNQFEYLVDVGFGEFAFNPLLLEPDKIQQDPRSNFIIETKSDSYIVLKIKDDVKNIEYKFINKERALCEFHGMCEYHQTSPNSHFTQKKLISKPTYNGRITITGNILKITEDGIIQKSIEIEKENYAKQLYKWFAIDELKIKANH